MGQAIGRIEILPDPLALAHHVAKWMTQAALAAEGSFRVSLSGGSTPKTLYGLLASDEFRDRFPWQLMSWYWGDERFVPHDHPAARRYERTLQEAYGATTLDPQRPLFDITGLMNGGRSYPLLIKSNPRVRPGRRCTALCPLLAQSRHSEMSALCPLFGGKADMMCLF